MYLPTFWKLCMENRLHAMKHISPWAVPTLFMCKFEKINSGCWISYYSLYNWIFTSIIPPDRGISIFLLSRC